MEKRRSVFDVLSDDIFTDREELIAVLKEIALGAKVQRYISPVLIGHRRVGKTEVLKRLYNELFWEQDEVVPIYITFEDLSRESRQFATEYFGAFLSQYVGFKEKDVELARSAEFAEIIESAQRYAKENNNYGLSHILDEYYGAAKTKEFTWPVLDYAIWAPRRVSRDNEEPMFVMLDEFQHVIEIRDENGITKNIFYFATRYQDEKIDKKRIAESMKHWGVTEGQVMDILLALSRADLIEEKVAGTEFYNIKDPILREFADAWARVDVENATWEEANVELQERYNKLQWHWQLAASATANLKGYATELEVIGGEKVTRWYVSTNGFTQDATDYLNIHEFLYSDRNQINQLLQHFGLRELPV